jgi:hypothetical protein
MKQEAESHDLTLRSHPPKINKEKINTEAAAALANLFDRQQREAQSIALRFDRGRNRGQCLCIVIAAAVTAVMVGGRKTLGRQVRGRRGRIIPRR